MNAQPHNLRRRGFTFVELCIGMVVTSLVLAAMAAFSLATATAWNAGTTTTASGGKSIAAVSVIGTLASTRLDNELNTALLTGGYYSGTLTSSVGQQASILLWKINTTNTSSIDTGEVYLIEYDATDHTIYKWSPGGASTTLPYATFSNASWIATFKLTGTKKPLARNVDGMQIYVQTPTKSAQLPLVEYRLYFNRNGKTETRYGAACLRNPSKPGDLTLS